MTPIEGPDPRDGSQFPSSISLYLLPRGSSQNFFLDLLDFSEKIYYYVLYGDVKKRFCHNFRERPFRANPAGGQLLFFSLDSFL
jgi:hypothetical protein